MHRWGTRSAQRTRHAALLLGAPPRDLGLDELDRVEQEGLDLVALLQDDGGEPLHVRELLRLELHELAQPLRVELHLGDAPPVRLYQHILLLLHLVVLVVLDFLVHHYFLEEDLQEVYFLLHLVLCLVTGLDFLQIHHLQIHHLRQRNHHLLLRHHQQKLLMKKLKHFH